MVYLVSPSEKSFVNYYKINLLVSLLHYYNNTFFIPKLKVALLSLWNNLLIFIIYCFLTTVLLPLLKLYYYYYFLYLTITIWLLLLLHFYIFFTLSYLMYYLLISVITKKNNNAKTKGRRSYLKVVNFGSGVELGKRV